MLNSIGYEYDSVQRFNNIAGNLDPDLDLKANLEKQIDFITEELKETKDELELGNYVGVLDGACDLFVTVAGLMQKLESKGFLVKAAVQAVNDNNLSKFPAVTSGKPETPDGWTVTESSGYMRYVIKDENGKIRKPVNFTPVNLVDYVPKQYLPKE